MPSLLLGLVLFACIGATDADGPDDPAPAEVPPTPEPPEVPANPDWPAPTEERYAGSHILVAWKGAVDAPQSVTRSESEARALAEELRSRATPETFADLAAQHSDGRSAPRGGRLGTWRTGTMVPDFERAIASVAPGEVGPLVRTPFGWHVVLREAVEEVSVAHILVAFQGGLQPGAERSRDDARTRAEQLLAEIEGGADFAEVARENSDDDSARQGGSLGRIARGQMVPAFEDAAFGLKPGETTIVESPYGFHIVRRE
jgi:peptidyl-prolyl cis-trans isomerase SurA